MQLGLHARHGIDLPGHGRNEEGIHHGRGGDLEADRVIHRGRQFIDGGNALLRVDKQPLPVQRHHFHGERLQAHRHRGLRINAVQRAVRVQFVGAHPGHGAQGDDDHQRNRPDHQFQHGGMGPVGLVVGLGVAFPVMPGKPQRQHDHRHNDQQHQYGCPDEQIPLLHGHVTRGGHHDCVTARQQGSDKQRQRRSTQVFE